MKHDFKVVSNIQCVEKGCETQLKQNLIDRNPDATRCYKHHMKRVRKNPRYAKI
jgi:hypothetical protein